MYGFMPSATTEKCDSPPPENRSSRPTSALPCDEGLQLRLVDARDRHRRQQPEDDQQAEDVQDPPPDVGRAEGVEKRFEHGSGVVAGGFVRRRSAADGSSASGSTVASGSSVDGRAGIGRLLGRAAASSRSRPSRLLGRLRLDGGGLGGLAACGGLRRRRSLPSALASATSAAAGSASGVVGLGRAPGATSRPWPRRSTPWRRRPRASTPSAASGVLGISRTLTLPPARLDLGSGRCRERVGDHEERDRQVAGAQDLERLVQRPHQTDGAQDVLVDRDRRRPWPTCRRSPRPRTRRDRPARRWRRR